VTLWLPVTSNDAVSEDGGVAVAAQGSGAVLLVDDEALVRSTTAAMLGDMGFVVTEADGAAAALKLLGMGHAADLLVTDYLMPETNGAELIAAARALRPGLPAMLVTGYTDAHTLDPTLPRLTKPFRRAELASAVAKLLATPDAA
jgi:CheY-like chemotaxis protein